MTSTTLDSDSFPEYIGQGLALVDYDNVCGYKSKSKTDAELHTTDLVGALVRAFRALFPDLKELDIRLYGGWIDELGLPSPTALWLLPTLPALRGRRHGLIVRPSLATTMVQFPDLILRGTVRLHTRRIRQKMVDGMLGCDAVFAAGAGLVRVGLVTDDDDLVPAALSAHEVNTDLIVWMRTRSIGRGLNDRSLSDRGLRIHLLEENGDD